MLYTRTFARIHYTHGRAGLSHMYVTGYNGPNTSNTPHFAINAHPEDGI